jgi:hypothetical protein
MAVLGAVMTILKKDREANQAPEDKEEGLKEVELTQLGGRNE